MKKYISVLFLIVFIIPSIALASWWNPLGWKIFQKKESVQQVQVETQKTSEEKINELQKQLDELKNQQDKKLINKNEVNNFNKTEVVSFKKEINNLQILNIKSQDSKEKIVITWETTLPSKSRLILINNDGKEGYVFESSGGLNMNHSVNISNIDMMYENKYKIIATTENKETQDDFYGSFISNYVDYKFFFGEINENECQIIILKDSNNKVVVGKELKIRGIYKTKDENTNFIKNRKLINSKTNLKGEVIYCEKANMYEINGIGINNIILNK